MIANLNNLSPDHYKGIYRYLTIDELKTLRLVCEALKKLVDTHQSLADQFIRGLSEREFREIKTSPFSETMSIPMIWLAFVVHYRFGLVVLTLIPDMNRSDMLSFLFRLCSILPQIGILNKSRQLIPKIDGHVAQQCRGRQAEIVLKDLEFTKTFLSNLLKSAFFRTFAYFIQIPNLKSLVTKKEFLLLAIEKGDAETYQLLLSLGVDPEELAEDGRTHLHLAASYGSATIMSLIPKVEEKINLRDKHGFTPMHLACLSASKEAVQFLIGKGANFILQANSGALPHFLAFKKGGWELVRYLELPPSPITDHVTHDACTDNSPFCEKIETFHFIRNSDFFFCPETLKTVKKFNSTRGKLKLSFIVQILKAYPKAEIFNFSHSIIDDDIQQPLPLETYLRSFIRRSARLILNGCHTPGGVAIPVSTPKEFAIPEDHPKFRPGFTSDKCEFALQNGWWGSFLIVPSLYGPNRYVLSFMDQNYAIQHHAFSCDRENRFLYCNQLGTKYQDLEDCIHHMIMALGFWTRRIGCA